MNEEYEHLKKLMMTDSRAIFWTDRLGSMFGIPRIKYNDGFKRLEYSYCADSFIFYLVVFLMSSDKISIYIFLGLNVKRYKKRPLAFIYQNHDDDLQDTLSIIEAVKNPELLPTLVSLPRMQELLEIYFSHRGTSK